MSKASLLNLILLITVASLASFIFLSEEPSNELERLSNVDSKNISHISIHHNNGTTELKKSGVQWQLTQPITIAANTFRIESILKLINAPVHSKYVITEIDPVTIGLTEASTSIQFDDMLIRFGITNPATRLRYIQLGDRVYTIEDVYYPLLSSHFGTLVALNLLPADSKIEKLELPELSVSKGDSGLWQSSTDLSADDIVSLIDNWQHAQAFGIHEYLPRGDHGKATLKLAGKPQTITFVITDLEPWLILARPELGLEYHLDFEASKKLITPEGSVFP